MYQRLIIHVMSQSSRKKSTTNRLPAKIFAWFLLVFWCAVIFYFSSENGDASAELSDGLLAFLHLPIDVFWLRKIAHFTEFFILGFLALNVVRVSFKVRRKTIIMSFLFCVLYAALDEFHQTFVAERAPRVMDILVDVAGSFVAIMLYNYYLKRYSRTLVYK